LPLGPPSWGLMTCVWPRAAVSAQPPPLDSRQTSITTTIGTERIEELPVRSRNCLEVVLLAPRVTRPERQTTAGVVSSTLSDSGFGVGGRRPRRNTLTIDGLDHNDEFTGATPTELSLGFVREFQVITNGWSVETAGQRAESDERHPGEYGVRPASFASPILRTGDRGGARPATPVFHRFRVLRGGS